MQGLRTVFARSALGQFEELRANSLHPVGRFHEKFVTPGTLPRCPKLQSKHGEVSDGNSAIPGHGDKAIVGRLQQFGQALSNHVLVKGLGPWMVAWPVAYQKE
jgi:hypothetical protein